MLPRPRPAPITGHTQSNRTQPSSQPPANGKSGITCFKCNKFGHIAANCLSSHPNMLTAEDDSILLDCVEEDFTGIEGHSLVARSLFLAPQALEEDWRHRNIFSLLFGS